MDVLVRPEESDCSETSSERALVSDSPSASSVVEARRLCPFFEKGELRCSTILVAVLSGRVEERAVLDACIVVNRSLLSQLGLGSYLDST